MYKKTLSLIGVMWYILGFSQTETTLNSYSPPQTVKNETVRLLPGFHANSNDGSYHNGEIFIATVGEKSDSQLPPSANTPTLVENYIYERSYLYPVTSSNPYAPQIQNITYFDGIGRPKQKISIKSSPNGKDLVIPIVYDPFGRKVLDYLPIPQSGTKKGELYPQNSQSYTIAPFPVDDDTNFYLGEKIYSEQELEKSYLNRIKKFTQPGNLWQNNPITYSYDDNSANDVLKFKTTSSWSNENSSKTISLLSLDSGIYYTVSQLYKNQITDEDGNVLYEFKNAKGELILSRKNNNNNNTVDTYYVYNEYGQLAFVLSPLASDAVRKNTNVDLNSDGNVLSLLSYQYRYDDKNRLVEKKLPGKGWEYMVYDQQDRLVGTQDAELAKSKNWLFTKYDQFGRVAITGSMVGGDRNTEQNLASGKGSNNVTRDDSINVSTNNIKLYYNYSGTYPEAISDLYGINYYDTYPPYPDLPVVGDYDQYGQKFLKQIYISSEHNSHTQISTNGLATASVVKSIVGNTWTKNYTFYDQYARPIHSQTNNHLKGYTKNGSLLDFSGSILKSYTKHKRSSASAQEVIINERFVYDHQNRLKQHYHKVNNKSEVLLTDNTYDELSRLKIKKVGNELQTVNYSYNISGWLTGINDPSSNVTMGSDLFGYKIRYNEPIAGLSTPNALDYPDLEVKKRYNGNIAEIDWNSVDVGSLDPMELPYRYGYVYDNLNRLKAGFYQNPYNPAKGEGNEIVDEYDLNGNIVKLKRFAYKSKSRIAQKIDDLVYHYSGNQVTKVDDNPGQQSNPLGYPGGSGTIEYDLNGNMKLMQDKGISKIEYNYLNLPTTIVQPNPTSYTYRADGVKLSKLFTVNNDIGSTTIRTEYLDGFQYNSGLSKFGREVLNADDPLTINSLKAGQMEVFQPVDEERLVDIGIPDTEPAIIEMKLQFFPTSEGFYDYKNSKYIYQYKDHLGNVRLSYARNTETNQPEVLDRNDYYPFGMNVTENYSVFDAQGTPFNYKYNGKELQETGMYDYGARFYMPDLGRWGVVDELAEISRRWSPYSYAFNNPIRYVDPDGRSNKDWVKHGAQITYDPAINGSVAAIKKYGEGAQSINGYHVTKDGITTHYKLDQDGSITITTGNLDFMSITKSVFGSKDIDTGVATIDGLGDRPFTNGYIRETPSLNTEEGAYANPSSHLAVSVLQAGEVALVDYAVAKAIGYGFKGYYALRQSSITAESFSLHPRLYNTSNRAQFDAGHRATTFVTDEVIQSGKVGIKDFNSVFFDNHTLYFNKNIGGGDFSIGINPYTKTIFHQAPGVFK